jgi:Protein of unknown function (DUF1501)
MKKKMIDEQTLESRRDFLFSSAMGFGGIALSALLAQETSADAAIGVSKSGPQSAIESSLAPKPPHLPAKAKACIFLLMDGGPSHIDTFDPKPKLRELHMKEFVRERTKFVSNMESGKRYYVASPFNFNRARNGMEICEYFSHVAECVDDICFYRGGQADSVNHPTALYHLNTGSMFGAEPAVGAWATYGLGTMNQNLPAFVVLPDVIYPQGGAPNWSNGFLPPHFQGTPLRASGAPILDLEPPPDVTKETQRRNLDLLNELNRRHQEQRPNKPELAARIEAYELAFRMQSEIPGIVDIENESAATKRLYGIGEKETDAFGRRCLLARRLVEKGVRFVQVYSSGWDSHDDIATAHKNRMRAVDKPIAGLLKDLKRTGLLESTLVIWAGEFGRSPDNGVRGGMVYGRDHNPKGMTMWFAGGDVKPGIVGATDEIGGAAVEVVHPLRDIHVTMLRLLGLDDGRLRYLHNGRQMQLSQFGGQVIKQIVS